MPDPKVSIVMPAYNAELFIGEAIDSVLEQDLRDWELAVVDDGSTDGTHEIIASYARRDDRIVGISHNCNRGPSAARNAGMRATSGGYIAFLDADDRWFRDKLGRQAGRLAAFPNIRSLFTGIEIIDIKRNVIESWEQIHEKFPDSHVTPALLIGKHNIVVGGGSTIMMARSLIEEIGYFDESMRSAEDWDYWYRIAGRGGLELLPAKLAQIRRHNTSAQANSEDTLLGRLLFSRNVRRNCPHELTPGLNAIEAEALYRLVAYYWYSRNAKRFITILIRLLGKYPSKTVAQVKASFSRKLA